MCSEPVTFGGGITMVKLSAPAASLHQLRMRRHRPRSSRFLVRRPWRRRSFQAWECGPRCPDVGRSGVNRKGRAKSTASTSRRSPEAKTPPEGGASAATTEMRSIETRGPRARFPRAPAVRPAPAGCCPAIRGAWAGAFPAPCRRRSSGCAQQKLPTIHRRMPRSCARPVRKASLAWSSHSQRRPTAWAQERQRMCSSRAISTSTERLDFQRRFRAPVARSLPPDVAGEAGSLGSLIVALHLLGSDARIVDGHSDPLLRGGTISAGPLVTVPAGRRRCPWMSVCSPVVVCDGKTFILIVRRRRGRFGFRRRFRHV